MSGRCCPQIAQPTARGGGPANTRSMSPPATVALASPEDVVGVIPAMLGFHPRESLVVLGLRGDRRRSSLTMRTNLPPPGVPPTGLVELVVERLRGCDVDGALAVVYTSRGSADLPHATLAERLGEGLRRAGIECLDVLLVADRRIRSYLCRSEACCSLEGIPIPQLPTAAAQRFHAEVVELGGRIWDSREQLEASVAAPTGTRAEALERAFRRASDALTDDLVAAGPDGVRAGTAELLHAVHGRYVEGAERISDEEAARLCLGLADVAARDDLLVWGGGERPDALLSLLGDLAASSLPPSDVPVCVALAWTAYQAGNGVLAGCAVDRALATDPTSTLGQLLRRAIEVALPPERLLTVADAVPTFPGRTTDERISEEPRGGVSRSGGAA